GVQQNMGIRRFQTHIAAIICVAATAIAGCGGQTERVVQPPATAEVAPPTLPASAVPYLPSHMAVLSPADLLRDGRQPGLVADLHKWGFRAAAQRTFQGESHRLQLVVA